MKCVRARVGQHHLIVYYFSQLIVEEGTLSTWTHSDFLGFLSSQADNMFSPVSLSLVDLSLVIDLVGLEFVFLDLNVT